MRLIATIEVEKKAKEDVVLDLSDHIVDMYPKEYNKCKAILFADFRDKKYKDQDVEGFFIDHEEEKKIEEAFAETTFIKQ